MTTIKYIKGDATSPQGSGMKIIVHVCNDVGGWGAGFVLAISKKWQKPERCYREAFAHKPYPKLGLVQIIPVSKDIIVANMIAQHGIGTGSNGPPIRYDAVRKCLNQIAAIAKTMNASVHGPRFGAGLSGGKWDKIEPIIQEELIDKGIAVTVYDFNG